MLQRKDRCRDSLLGSLGGERKVQASGVHLPLQLRLQMIQNADAGASEGAQLKTLKDLSGTLDVCCPCSLKRMKTLHHIEE